jgi:deoxyribonuclease-4
MAAERANSLNCETMQLFSHNPRAWTLKKIEDKEAELFKEAVSVFGISPVAVHMPYRPNFASFDKDLYQKSTAFLCENINRANVLGSDFLVVHPGSFGQNNREQGISRIAGAINIALERTNTKVKLLLENTAGQGTEIGNDFSQLKKIISFVNKKNHIGICLDTAHAFASGLDIATEKGLNHTLEDFDRKIGIKKLCCLHLNDSKTRLGSRADRHCHLGKGHIGLEGFRLILTHPLLKDLPGIMETPGKTDKENQKNMDILKELSSS